MRRALAPLLVLGLAGSPAAGCGEGVVAGSGPPAIVAAENTWGSVAAQIAGPAAVTRSIITSPAQDPHAYEPTALDARTMATAGLAIVNGAGYDPWARRLIAADPAPGRIVLDVGRLLHVPPGGNPHRWYDPADVLSVARAIAADLARLAPGQRAAIAGRLSRFQTSGLAAYHAWVARIRSRFAGVAVGASESIFAPLAPALGLRLTTPPGFLRAISEGSELSAADMAAATAQLAAGRIAVWVVNRQNAAPGVERLSALARRRGIPVVGITETLAPAGESFQAWQVRQLAALAAALHEATGR